jgi:hypothetical protein
VIDLTSAKAFSESADKRSLELDGEGKKKKR